MQLCSVLIAISGAIGWRYRGMFYAGSTRDLAKVCRFFPIRPIKHIGDPGVSPFIHAMNGSDEDFVHS